MAGEEEKSVRAQISEITESWIGIQVKEKRSKAENIGFYAGSGVGLVGSFGQWFSKDAGMAGEIGQAVAKISANGGIDNLEMSAVDDVAGDVAAALAHKFAPFGSVGNTFAAWVAQYAVTALLSSFNDYPVGTTVQQAWADRGDRIAAEAKAEALQKIGLDENGLLNPEVERLAQHQDLLVEMTRDEAKKEFVDNFVEENWQKYQVMDDQQIRNQMAKDAKARFKELSGDKETITVTKDDGTQQVFSEANFVQAFTQDEAKFQEYKQRYRPAGTMELTEEEMKIKAEADGANKFNETYPPQEERRFTRLMTREEYQKKHEGNGFLGLRDKKLEAKRQQGVGAEYDDKVLTLSKQITALNEIEDPQKRLDFVNKQLNPDAADMDKQQDPKLKTQNEQPLPSEETSMVNPESQIQQDATAVDTGFVETPLAPGNERVIDNQNANEQGGNPTVTGDAKLGIKAAGPALIMQQLISNPQAMQNALDTLGMGEITKNLENVTLAVEDVKPNTVSVVQEGPDQMDELSQQAEQVRQSLPDNPKQENFYNLDPDSDPEKLDSPLEALALKQSGIPIDPSMQETVNNLISQFQQQNGIEIQKTGNDAFKIPLQPTGQQQKAVVGIGE